MYEYKKDVLKDFARGAAVDETELIDAVGYAIMMIDKYEELERMERQLDIEDNLKQLGDIEIEI